MKELKFSISDVAEILGIVPFKESRGELFCRCPICGDERGKFSYLVSKKGMSNLYKCFHCNNGGDAIDLYMKVQGVDDRKEAYREIMKSLEGKTPCKSIYVPQSEHKEQKASEKCISDVYIALLKECSLQEEHKKDLLRRGLSEEDIELFAFKSVPNKEDAKKIINSLCKRFSLEGVPGFFKEGTHWYMKLNTGYFCPVFDMPRKRILGMQINTMRKDGAKYIWFSSTELDGGASSGASSIHLLGKDPSVVIATEGILKASVIYCLLQYKYSVIGVPGIGVLGGLKPHMKTLNDNAFIFECYDMDKKLPNEKGERISQQAEKLANLFAQENKQVHPTTWDVDANGSWQGVYKGLDDMLEATDVNRFFKFVNKTIKESVG